MSVSVSIVVAAPTLQITRTVDTALGLVTYQVDTRGVGYAAARVTDGWYFASDPRAPGLGVKAGGLENHPNVLYCSPVVVFGPDFATVRDAAFRAFQSAFSSQIDTDEERLQFALNGKINVRNMVRTAFRAAGASAAEVAT